jgi:hypothetical protein
MPWSAQPSYPPMNKLKDWRWLSDAVYDSSVPLYASNVISHNMYLPVAVQGLLMSRTSHSTFYFPLNSTFYFLLIHVTHGCFYAARFPLHPLSPWVPFPPLSPPSLLHCVSPPPFPYKLLSFFSLSCKKPLNT